MSTPGRVGRLRAGVRRRVGARVGGRFAGAAGLDELGGLEAAVDSLEVAVTENHELAGPLTGIVDALERDVAEVLSRRGGGGMGA